MPKEKGIFWAFELGIGLLILSMALHASATNQNPHANELAFQLCLDLQEIWIRGKELETTIDTFFSDKQITLSKSPSYPMDKDQITCKAMRTRNGILETQFIAIQY